MLVKFFKGGRTYKGAKSAVDYLLNERLEQGTAQVIKGDPNLTLKIISQIKNKWKFSSGVISFEEKINSSLLPQIIEEFERTFFAGMDKDQYNILWIKHEDKGRTELHFIIPKIELKTWKAFNPYLHKKDLKKKDLFQDYINKKYDFKSPKQIERYATKAEIKWSNKNNELKKQINAYIEEAIGKGLVEDREDIVNLLIDAGFIVKRKGKNYISVILPGMTKAIRLKGAIYEEDFSIRRAVEKERRRNQEYVSRELEEIRRELEERISKDAKYNEGRYKVVSEQGIRTTKSELGEHRLGIGTMSNSQKMEMGDRGNYRRNIINNSDNLLFNRNNNNDLGRHELYKQSLVSQVGQTEKSIIKGEEIGRTIERIREFRATQKRYIGYIKNLIPRTEQVNNTEYRRDEKIKPKDRRTTRDNIQTTATDRKINNIIRGISKYIKSGIKLVRRIIMGNREELERFKIDINIADVAIDMGYEIDKKKSSRKSIVLKLGGDVIIISRNSNGHYVYFNANDSKDSGTIIDFIQNRTGKNLGQVRKLLRQYLQSGNRIQLEISNTNEIKEYYKTLDKFSRLWEEIKETDTKKEFFRYGEDIRGISKDTLFKVKNLAFDSEKWLFYFPIFNQNGICGLYTLDKQMKNKSFVKGSIKGIWANRTLDKGIKKIIITESPVDSLSAMELKRGDEDEDTTLHIATLGRMGQEAKETLRKVFKYLPNAELIIATDQDQAGEDIAREIAELAKEAGLNNVNRLTYNAKDLNEYLQIKKGQEQIYSPSYRPRFKQ